MTDTDEVEQEWIRSLVREAQRDCVFLWQITNRTFGGGPYISEEMPLAIARVATALINSGCKVGFGNPDSETWQPGTYLQSAENPGAVIAARWLADPTDIEFLVFVQRYG